MPHSAENPIAFDLNLGAVGDPGVMAEEEEEEVHVADPFSVVVPDGERAAQALVPFGGRRFPPATPQAGLPLLRGSTPMATPAMLSSAHKALEDAGMFLSSREADLSA